MELNNDFKSINIDKFIKNFKQTYPHYLEMAQTKADMIEVQNKGVGISGDTKEQSANRRRSSTGDGPDGEVVARMEEYVIGKPPDASSELNNYIKYGF